MLFKQLPIQLFLAVFSLFFAKNATSQTYFTIKFPDDATVIQCNATPPVTPPIITGNACLTDVGVSHTDEIFTVVPDACVKIVRTWTVLYWCDFDPNWIPTNILNPVSTTVGPTVEGNLGNHGYLKYVQIIKIVDSGDPVLAACPDLIFKDFSANDPSKYNTGNGHDLCEGAVSLSTKAWDACSGSNLTFRYLLFLDLNADGAFDSTLVSEKIGAFLITKTVLNDTAFAQIAFPSGFELPHGKHMIKWIVRDGCGHESVCSQFFTIKDAKNPTVVCIAGLSIPLMNGSNMAAIWATDFLKYTFDNCTPSDLLDIGIRRLGTGAGFPVNDSLVLNCDDLGLTPIEIWAKDAAGNADFCETYILVQTNVQPSPCQSAPVQPFGKVQKTDNSGMISVKMTLSGGQIAAPMAEMTDLNGQFLFPKVPSAQPYLLAPMLVDDFKTEISLADAERLRAHLLGINLLQTPVEMLAADVNLDKKVDWADFQLLRDLANGAILEWPNAGSAWHFFPKNTLFLNQKNPWETTFSETILVTGIGAVSADFTAYKLGDLVSATDIISPVNPTLATQNVDNQLITWLGARPNPFSDRCDLVFDLRESSNVSMSIFDIFGKEIVAENRQFAEGEQTWSLDATRWKTASTGVFFVKIRVENEEILERLVRR